MTVALDPGRNARADGGTDCRLPAPPGYGEMFTELGFGTLVDRARAGAKRSELAEAITVELLGQVCAIGSSDQIEARLAEYRAAGANHIGVVPATAEDPAGQPAAGRTQP